MIHKHGGDVYSYHGIKDFSANINFRGMPPSVREAAVQAVDESIHYPDPECRSLKVALAKRETGVCNDILPEHLICGNGAAELIFALAGALRPEKALVAAPSFYEYEQALGAFGCEITRFALTPENDFLLEESFLSAVSAFASKASFSPAFSGEIYSEAEASEAGAPVGLTSLQGRPMIILGNPNNPTGALIETDELFELIRLCDTYHIMLVLDESFMDFLDREDQKRTISGAASILKTPNLFIIRSFTKIYALPGIRFGYGLCSDCGLLERMRMLLQPWNVSVVAQRAAEAAAAESEFARISAGMISENRASLIAALREAGVTVFPSSANFLLIRGPANLKEACLEHGILIRDCGNFPGLEPTEDGQGYFRVCVRSREENEELAVVILQCMRQHNAHYI